MIDISNEGIITLSRGDTFRFPLFINKGTEIAPIRYELTENDMLYFAVMEPNQKFEDAIIKKVYTSESEKNEFGDIYIVLEPTDTEYLLGGKYYYEVKLRTLVNADYPDDENSYEVQTIIPKRGFQLLGTQSTPTKSEKGCVVRGTIAVPINIQENGEFTPPQGKLFNKVVVNVPAGGDIPAGSITTDKIADGAVTAEKLSDDLLFFDDISRAMVFDLP